MSREKLLAGGVLSGLLCTALTAQVWAQRNPAVPDFSSNQAAWIVSQRQGWITVPGSPSPVRTDPKYPYVPNNNEGRQPTYRIADLTNPNLKPWAKERMKKENEEVLAGKIAYTARASCMPAGVPGFMLFVVEPVFFVQSAREVLIIYSGDAQVRRIHLGVPHSEKPKPSWYGESVGHYEGDTLVVDTIGLNDRTFIDNYRTPHTEKLHVTERWKLIDDGQTLEVQFTVEDPDTFYEPWSAIQRYRRVQRSYSEEICAENNAQLFDYHIPVAGKPDF